MRFKQLFHRAKGSSKPAPELSGAREVNAPLAQSLELQEAWAELTEAAKSSKVVKFPRLHPFRGAVGLGPRSCPSSGRDTA